MEIDRKMLDRICNMSDEEISSAVGTVAGILGANKNLAAKIASDPEKIRKTIGNASDRDLRRVTSAINERDLNAIIEKLGLCGGQNG